MTSMSQLSRESHEHSGTDSRTSEATCCGLKASRSLISGKSRGSLFSERARDFEGRLLENAWAELQMLGVVVSGNGS